MNDNTAPFVFPNMPDEAVVAADQFFEAFYHHFQNHYGLQLYRCYHALDERDAYTHPMPSPPSPVKDPPF